MAAGFGERQRAEEFARLLDSLGSFGAEPGAGVATLEYPGGSGDSDDSGRPGGPPLGSASIPPPRPPSDPELASMLRAVESVIDFGRRRAPEIRPRFKEELGLRLHAEFLQLFDADVPKAGGGPGDPAGRHRTGSGTGAGWRRRLISGGVVVGVLSGGAGGVAWAASSALPGDPLYPVKRGLENIRTTFSGSDAERGDQYLGQARTRLDEIEKLLDRKDANVDGSEPSSLIAGTMDNLYGDVSSAGQLLIPLAAHGDTGALNSLSEFLAAEEPPVSDLEVLLAPESQDKARRLLALMQSYDEQLKGIRQALANRAASSGHPGAASGGAGGARSGASPAVTSGGTATAGVGLGAVGGELPGGGNSADPGGSVPSPSADPTLSLQVPIGSSPTTVELPPLLSGLPPIGITIGGGATGPTSATAPPDTDPNPN